MSNAIHPIPAFTDNYIWAIRCGNQCLVVDPGDATPVLSYLEQTQVKLAGILITHHHADHTGGLNTLLNTFPGCPVYGPQGNHIKGITIALGDGDQLEPLPGLTFKVLTVPGHTLDHIAFFASEGLNGPPLLFCGDTLFAGGCGRIFEGDPGMMYTSLSRLTELPDQTQVYCAHEYTMANLGFAAKADPDNSALFTRIKTEQSKREKNEPTLPSTIGIELRTNPFLRCHNTEVATQVAQHWNKDVASSATEIFADLRRWKDNA
ncbi:hydroxyacylglutathione hydrolase [Pseudohongiella nitratireducens]|uniref:Hydroxyacylglutathione hydrolase n=1 Tax=Pseudohongiella nitratireducens TaxID=1768907 RepID=A0A916QJ55_9GAMM|nr:hydroxyacylglutathione hydrolase [Pseudohongiella nitratireducens]GFZ76486.1 hydroxyacylglutathione hydrolase [Pseudohongiella nitratireducens]